MALLPPLPPRLARIAAVLCLPAAAVIVALFATGQLAVVTTLAALAVTFLATAVTLWPFLREVEALKGYVGALGLGSPVAPPRLGDSFLGRELAGPVNRLDRAWRRRAEESIRALDLTETLLDALPDPLLLMDQDQSLIRANRAAQVLLGDDLTGQRLPRRVRIPSLLAAADGICADGIARQAEFALPGAAPRQFVARIGPLSTAERGERAFLITLHDVTEVKRTEQLRADFVANASHEIRTPLAAIIGLIETIRGPARDDPEAAERFLAVMAEHGQRINRLVDDLLSLSRIELSEHEAPTEAIPIGAALERTRAGLEWQAERRRITVRIEVDEGLPRVIGDAGELDQVIHNLLDNAIKYGPEGSVARLAARVCDPPEDPSWPRGAGALAVTVEDQGPGIPREHLGRLTERFYRVDKARSRAVGGTGLGLAIVKHIVNRHRGKLEIESTPGVGSRFTVYLPTAPEAAETKAS